MATNTGHRYNNTQVSSSDPFYAGTDRAPERTVLNGGERGGGHGWAFNTYEYVSEHPHIDQQGWLFTLSTPGFFSKFKFGRNLHSLLKSAFETRSISWQGPTEKYDFDFADQKWGGRTMSVPQGATRTLGPFSLKLIDVMGEPYTSLFRIWGLWGIHDPDLGYPRMVLFDDLENGDMLIDNRSASVICFNTSEDLRDISHASMIVGMFPRSTVEVGIRRNKDESGQIREINMEFTGLIEFDTKYVRETARKFLKKLPFFNPDARRADNGFLEPTATVKSLREVGIVEQMKRESAKVDDPQYIA